MKSPILNPTAGDLWAQTSPSSELYTKMFHRLVPPSGVAPTTRGESLRALSKLYSDVYTNGGNKLTTDASIVLRLILGEYICDCPAPEHTQHVHDALNGVEAAIQRRIAAFSLQEFMEERCSPGDEVSHDFMTDTSFLGCLEKLAEYVIWYVYQADLRSCNAAEALGSEPSDLEKIIGMLNHRGIHVDFVDHEKGKVIAGPLRFDTEGGLVCMESFA